VEMEEWLDVSLSTDHDDSENFLASTDGKWYISDVKRKQ